MPKHHWFLSLFACISCWNGALPASGQALLPYTLELDAEQLELQGLQIAQEAAQLMRFQQFGSALPQAKLATQLAPEIYETWFLLGTLYLQLDEIDLGIEALQQARFLSPDQPGILFSLGAAYLQTGDYSRSIQELEAGLNLDPNAPNAWFDLGNAYFLSKQYNPAIAAYEDAVKQEDGFWPAINNIGLVQYEQGKVTEAIDHWQAAITIDQDAAEPLLAVAVALYTQGKQDQGLALGEKALRIDSRYSDLKFLKDNLWGDRLLQDTTVFLSTPQMQAFLSNPGTLELELEISP